MTQKVNLFAPILKVDEEKRMVYGRMVSETVDKVNEIFDYASSKPYFERWSAEIAKDTDGKSLGNVRAMHGKVAAGVVKAIDFNDAEKAIDIGAKVVDDNEWKKVLEGVYTGFSIGGSYVEGSRKAEKVNGKDCVRYTANPIETSLVDRPMIPTCKFFEVHRMDGTIAKVEFVGGPEEEVAKAEEPAPAEQQDFELEATPEQVERLLKTMADNDLSIEDVIGAAAHRGTMKVLFVEPFTAKVDVAARALELAKAEKPEATKAEDKHVVAAKAEQVKALRKAFISVGEFGYALDCLCRLHQSVEFEQFVEGDTDSMIPARLKAAINLCADILKDFVAEEQREYATDTSDYGKMLKSASEVLAALKKAYPGKHDALAILVEKAFPPKKKEEAKEEGGEEQQAEGGGGQQGGGQAQAGGGEGGDDAAFAAKLHAVALKLGATCGGGAGAAPAKAEAAQDLTKLLGSPQGQELVKAAATAAVEAAVAPLKAEMDAMKKMAAPAKVRLRAVSKADDVGGEQDDKPIGDKDVVKNADGTVNEVATMIKAQHRMGGQPLLGSAPVLPRKP